MKLSELPVFLDLVRLPLPVLVKRILNRFVKGGHAEISYSAPELLSWNTKIGEAPFPRLDEGEKNNILLNHYMGDELNHLGSGWTSLRNNVSPSGFENWRYGSFPRTDLTESSIDWNRDQRTGYQFPVNQSSFEALKEAFVTEGVDVKFSWEFARMQHLPQLALAYHRSPKMQAEILSTVNRHIQSFAEQCEPGKGIHWSSPMEAAVRVTNILISYHWLREELAEVESQVLELAYNHYAYIAGHLEHKDGFGTNHYLSNLMGLIVVGYFVENAEIKDKAAWAWPEMERELQKQFFSDGFNFEYSTYYHRLSSEIALLSLSFALKQSFKVSAETKKIVAKAISSIEALMKPDGELPKFGDIDSGRILILNPDGEIRDGEFYPNFESCGFVTKLKKSGTLYNWFYKDALKEIGSVPINSLVPKASLNRTKRGLSHSAEWVLKYPVVNLGDIEHHYWPKAGLVVFKSDEFYLAVNLMANPNGHRYRGHSHNDKGSFELHVHGEQYVSDPGVLSYTASVDMRNRYRSTQAHPVPYTGVEQNRYLDGFLGLFHSRLDAEARVIKMSDHSLDCEIFYRGVKIYRRFEIKENKLIVSDWCNQPFTINKNNEVPLAAGYGKLQ